MNDNWWQILKGEFDNMKPIRGNVQCSVCNGTGVVEGTIGHGATGVNVNWEQHLELNRDHPLAPGASSAKDPIPGWAGWET